MIYLKSFTFPTEEQESPILDYVMTKWHNTVYPFKIASGVLLETLEFAPVTILYGSNGSGKTTLLNVMAQKLGVERATPFNTSTFFGDYLGLCTYEARGEGIPSGSRIITSDDVFDFVLNKRIVNSGIDSRRKQLIAEYLELKEQDNGRFRYHGDDDLQKLAKLVAMRNNTLSMFVKKNVGLNIREKSNGESAIRYFFDNITENALYLLDEPENSLAPLRQQELVQYLEEAVRFYNCQFIIASHSPFVLAMCEAKVYDLDIRPVEVKRWHELEGIRFYYDFFKKHEDKFEV